MHNGKGQNQTARMQKMFINANQPIGKIKQEESFVVEFTLNEDKSVKTLL